VSPIAICFLLLLAPAVTFAQSPRSGADALARRASEALEEKRFGDALAAFTEAVGIRPRDAELWTGKGMTEFMLGQNEQAETSLVRALTLNPRLTDASLFLGELQFRGGRAADAIATYESALKHIPGEETIVAKLEHWRKDVRLSERMYESRGSHFRVLFEGPADQAMARRAVEYLEAAYWRIGAALTTYPQDATTVVLYTIQQFRDLTRAPDWSGGVYDGQIRVAVKGALDHPEELERVLAHEFVHAVVAKAGGQVPLWLNEGLATLFEPGGVDWARSVLDHAPSRIGLERLHNSFRRFEGAAVTIAYAESAVAVRRMIDLRGAASVMALLQDLQNGVPFESAFHQRMAMRYEDFRSMLQR
jgi:tetratricopeptide (TPR) repeat protein